jgi:pyridoxine 4-dehydrogenase
MTNSISAPVRIANKLVGPIGYGMLSLSIPWLPIEHEAAAALLKQAVEQGANLWNSVCSKY